MSKTNGYRTRFDFSKIPATIQIPNLIEVQRRSYERFLQMDRLPSERDDAGLQAVFQSVFPISDFRNVSQLEFVDYAIGNWECKCGHLKGLHHLRTTCKSCGSTVITDPFHPGDVLCNKCGTYNANTPDFCNKCGDPVGLQLKYDVAECEERGMTYSAPLKVTMRLTIFDKDAETNTPSDIKEQEVFVDVQCAELRHIKAISHVSQCRSQACSQLDNHLSTAITLPRCKFNLRS